MNRPSGENVNPRSPCSPPAVTCPRISRTDVGSTWPPRIATTTPSCSATYRASSPSRTAIAIGEPSSLASCTRRTCALDRSGDGLVDAEGEPVAAVEEPGADGREGLATVEPPPPHPVATSTISPARAKALRMGPGYGPFLRIGCSGLDGSPTGDRSLRGQAGQRQADQDEGRDGQDPPQAGHARRGRDGRHGPGCGGGLRGGDGRGRG